MRLRLFYYYIPQPSKFVNNTTKSYIILFAGFKQRNGAANDLTVSMENGRSTSNSTQLPSLNIANEKLQTEKKKKKKKKRKHIDEESGVELSGYNNLVYDDMGHSVSVPT